MLSEHCSSVVNHHVSLCRVVELWKAHLAQSNKKAADSLADPGQYENLFPGMAESLVAEQYLAATEERRPAQHYAVTPVGSMWLCTLDSSRSRWMKFDNDDFSFAMYNTRNMFTITVHEKMQLSV